MRPVITAAYDRSAHALALAELLKRDGVPPVGIVVVNQLHFRRLRRLYRQDGLRGFLRAGSRLVGRSPAGRAPDPLGAFLAEQSIRDRSLRAWARRSGVRHRRARSMDDGTLVEAVRRSRADVVAYAGGGILGRATLMELGVPVLNAHHGPLPAIRGMNAVEWSILMDEPTVTTVHVIDPGIDTGPTLSSATVEPSEDDDLSTLRQRVLLASVLALRDAIHSGDVPMCAGDVPVSAEPDRGPLSRQCFVMAPALLELARLKLQTRQRRHCTDSSG